MRCQHEYYRQISLDVGDDDLVDVWVKGKLDLVVKGRYNIDIKTTAAKSKNAFEAHIKTFGYMMSQGHYHRLAKVEKSLLVVISTSTNEVFVRPFTEDQMQAGAKEFDRLLALKLKSEGYL